jgi:D-alanine--poly(phosphoribitol) ligase subunit 1
MSDVSSGGSVDGGKNYNLARPFADAASKYPDQIALCVDGRKFTYAAIEEEIARYVAWLQSRGTPPKRVGILAGRSAEAYIGILSSAWTGATYIPIDISLPERALIGIVRRSGLDALIADAIGSRKLSETLLNACPPAILAMRQELPDPLRGNVKDFGELPSGGRAGELAFVRGTEVGYMMYTSGSTGVPKAVMVPVRGVDHLLWTLGKDYPVRHDDRTAGTSPISFDVSVYDMFSTWRAGASLYVIPDNECLAPARFIQENEITIWSSAPSIAAQMVRMGFLKPNAFPSLRRSFFAGEALPSRVAAAWQIAAPNSKISNMYGPTEATVLCIGQDYSPSCHLTGDCIAIGWPYVGLEAAIVSEDLSFVEAGARGELLISGPQLALGYLDDEQKTGSAFVEIDGKRWYRTGDLAYRDTNGVVHYLGRIDHQVKVFGGARVELGEIESHIRELTGCESVAAVAWPQHESFAAGIVAFLGGYPGKVDEVRAALRKRLPGYMVPSRIHLLPELPLNSNGKIDRQKLAMFLAEHSR